MCLCVVEDAELGGEETGHIWYFRRPSQWYRLIGAVESLKRWHHSLPVEQGAVWTRVASDGGF